uniref:Uncharacterized protein n=1 Tax=Glossina pallidipes TaxID=7398 RepID=A0A1B0AGL2_GLOPL
MHLYRLFKLSISPQLYAPDFADLEHLICVVVVYMLAMPDYYIVVHNGNIRFEEQQSRPNRATQRLQYQLPSGTVFIFGFIQNIVGCFFPSLTSLGLRALAGEYKSVAGSNK